MVNELAHPGAELGGRLVLSHISFPPELTSAPGIAVAVNEPSALPESSDDADGDRIAPALVDVACSTRSACTSGASGPSHVLAALGRPEGGTTLRFGLGRFTTDDEIARVAAGLLESARA